MKVPNWFPCLLFAAIFAIPAVAEERKEPRSGPRAGGGPGEFLRNADKDGDGAVSLEEFSALERIARLPEEKRRALFARLDKDGDGFIRPDELPKGPRERGRRPPPPSWRQWDLNGDGVVEYHEFLESPFAKRLPEERRRAVFDRLDRNGDGKLSPEDRPQAGPGGGRGRPEGRGVGERFRQLDRNGDGVVDFEEFRQAPWIRDLDEDEQEERFEKLDRNGDLKLQPSEMFGGGAPPARPNPGGGRGPGKPGPARRGAPER